ncbi:hypothetical protein [Janthinobacterium tructae]|uniref:HNH endonuclease n=1 Tax=Janthinobacterium tructae TaxID=2590869 RepID=A0A4Y6RCK4_9BURK|nr:hypothetical protein [Janthinobacterium tructae]QDG70197.1 hypothetical protein FJQ89_07040 [Janthinobacterium tructae]
MIRLKRINATILSKHLAALEKLTLENIDTEFANIPIIPLGINNTTLELKIYLEDNISSLLAGSVAEIRRCIREIEDKFPIFHSYAQKNPSARSKNYDHDKTYILHAVRKSFDYDDFSKSRSQWSAYLLVKAYDIRLCPYCNINHVNFHYDVLPKKKSSVRKLEMRPPLDHYYPRAKYPYLGISIHNLIPSCHQCNSGVKLQDDPLSEKLPHPFKFPEKAVKFRLDNILAYDRPVALGDIKINVEARREVVRRHVDFFALPERYQWYAHEVQDMHNNYRSYVDADSPLEPALRNMVLGFKEVDREERALGICLNSILEHLLEMVPR